MSALRRCKSCKSERLQEKVNQLVALCKHCCLAGLINFQADVALKLVVDTSNVKKQH